MTAEVQIIETIMVFIPILILLALLGAFLNAMAGLKFGSGSDDETPRKERKVIGVFEYIKKTFRW